MANPQKENGSTDIANELLEAIYSFNFTANQFKIILCIIRYTYGFKRKSHNLSLNFIAKAINNNSKEFISREVKKLIKDNVLIEYSSPSFNSTRKIGINKDYSCWRSQQLTYKSTGDLEVNRTVDLQVNPPVDLQVNQETKNNKTKNKTKNIYVENSTIKFRFDNLWKLYPRKEGKANAFKKYQKICKKVNDEIIEQGIKNYVEKIKKENIEEKYIKMGSTWFNGECWNDEYNLENNIIEKMKDDDRWQ